MEPEPPLLHTPGSCHGSPHRPVQSVLPGRVQTELSSSKHTPRDAIAGIV